MKEIIIFDTHNTIKNTIGFSIFDNIDVVNHNKVIEFCRIIENYEKMCRLEAEVSEKSVSVCNGA